MENILFLVLVGVVGLIRLAMQAAEKNKNREAQMRANPPSANVPPVRGAAQSEEERIRKFFEALGVPAPSSSAPESQPRQVTPRIARAKKTIRPIDSFPTPRTGPLPVPAIDPSPPTAEVLANSNPTAPPPPPLPSPLKEITPSAAGTFEVYEVAASDSEIRPSAEGGILARLANAQGLRDAIILREILGPPRSTQQIG